MLAQLSHIRNWIFDLDNTLYPASAGLFTLVDARMGSFVADLIGCETTEAHRIQKAYFFEHGTTLAGLMADHGVDPHDFLNYVHDIDMSALRANVALADAIARLPGRKLVFTNGDAPYALRVLERLGLQDIFEAIHDIHAVGYQCKPMAAAYASLCDTHDIDPKESLFVEDMARNLAPAKAIGMTTVWVDNGSEQALGATGDFIDYTTHDIGHWLEQLLEDPCPAI